MHMKDTRTKTYRKNFVGKAKVPNMVWNNLNKDDKVTVLDFGCGKDAYWPKKFRKEKNILCDGIDLNCESSVGIPRLSSYEVVMVSNVLNVQETQEQLEETLKQIVSFCHYGSIIVWNYTESPRKMDLSTEQMRDEVRDAVWRHGWDSVTEEFGKNFFQTIIKKP